MAIVLMGRRFVQPKIEEMARAIMEFEGWFEDSVSQRNNNPGNLKFANQPGTIGTDNAGHAIFESFTMGWNALINQLKMAFENTSRVYTSNDTLLSFFRKYAEADSEHYAFFVADRLGVDPHTRLKNLT